jgi:hypothetical protein
MVAILCWVLIARAGDYNIMKSKTHIDFTPNPEFDTYEVTVKGTTIDDYVITYRILAYGGTELYSFNAKYVTVGVDPPEDKEGILRRLEREVENPCSERSGSLPPWTEVRNQGPGPAVTPKLSKSDYNRLRGSNLPLCTHSSGYERYKYVVFDPVAKKAKVIAEVAW